MKKLLFSLFAVTMIAVAAQAQEKPAEGQRPKHKTEMAEKLKFTEDQKAQLKTIHQESKKQLDELKKNDQITVKEYRERKKAIHDQHKTKMQSLLTADQKKQMEEMKKNHKGKKGDFRHKKRKTEDTTPV